MLIAQITDFHVRPAGITAYGDIDTGAMLGRALDSLAACNPRPDCVLVTGDLTDRGLPEEYVLVADALAVLPMPVFVVPGNHDRREVMRSCLATRYSYLANSPDFLHYVVEDFPIRLIGLDTVVPEQDGGELCARREAWLAECLAEGHGRPTIVFMHHPPFQTGVDGMDSIMCRTSPALPALIQRHPEVERVLTGHYHRSIAVRWAGTVGFVAPGTAHQVALNLRPGEPTRFVMEPPGYALHAWQPETGVVTHIVPIGNFGPTQEFYLVSDDPARLQ